MCPGLQNPTLNCQLFPNFSICWAYGPSQELPWSVTETTEGVNTHGWTIVVSTGPNSRFTEKIFWLNTY